MGEFTPSQMYVQDIYQIVFVLKALPLVMLKLKHTLSNHLISVPHYYSEAPVVWKTEPEALCSEYKQPLLWRLIALKITACYNLRNIFNLQSIFGV